MFCSNCGNKMTENALFCSACGMAAPPASAQTARTEAPFPQPSIIPAPIPEVPMDFNSSEAIMEDGDNYNDSAAEPDSRMDFAESVFRKPSGSMPTANVATQAPPPAPVIQPAPQMQPPPEAYYAPNPTKVKEEVFFGKGAFGFCIFLIALLAITAGIFAALYLSEIGFTLELW